MAGLKQRSVTTVGQEKAVVRMEPAEKQWRTVGSCLGGVT